MQGIIVADIIIKDRELLPNYEPSGNFIDNSPTTMPPMTL